MGSNPLLDFPGAEGHLALIEQFTSDGRIVIAGALGDPPHSGLLVFRSEPAAAEFVAADPYIAAGLVESHRLEPWNVVVS